MRVKIVLFFGVGYLIGVSFCMNIPSRSTNDPCSTSPCGINAICRQSNGLLVCNCKPDHKGDPFVHCDAMNNNSGSESNTSEQTKNPSTEQSPSNSPSHLSNINTPSVKIVPDQEITKIQNPVRFTVEYATSTDTVQDQDLSRIPILGDGNNMQIPINKKSPNKQPVQHQEHFGQSGQQTAIVHETTVHSQIQRHPPPVSQQPENFGHYNQHQFQSTNFNLKHNNVQLITSLNSIVSDPLGQYSNCKSIRGVIVCADTSDSPSSPMNPPTQALPLPEIITHTNQHEQSLHARPHPHQHKPLFQELLLDSFPISPGEQGCKSFCGVNSVCRMVKNTPVCGCPGGHTGDPGVRCVPLVNDKEKSGCEKHTECSSTEICVESKCVDPCSGIFQLGNLSGQNPNIGGTGFSSGTGSSGGMCGQNASCKVIEHTPLCACSEGFYGNPYSACLA